MNKEPWEMTKEQWLAPYKGRSKGSDFFPSWSRIGKSAAKGIRSQQSASMAASAVYHKKQVELALSQGKPVSLEVIKDYPDLAAKFKKAEEKMNRARKILSLIEKSKYVQRLPQDFTIFLELNAPADYEGMDDHAEVALAVEAEYERPDSSVGYLGGWSINSVEISKDFKFMGTLYKAQAVFPIGLIEYAPKFSKIDDMERRKKSFEDWVSSEVEESAGKRKGGM